MLTLDEDEVDAGLLAVLVREEADALAVFQETQVYIEPVERQGDFGNVETNRPGLTEQAVDQRCRKNVGLPHALPGLKSAEGTELVDQILCLLLRHVVGAA